MEDELEIKFCVSGYHVCSDIWEAAVGLLSERKPRSVNEGQLTMSSCRIIFRELNIHGLNIHGLTSPANTAKISPP